jgi:hypothetical protein
VSLVRDSVNFYKLIVTFFTTSKSMSSTASRGEFAASGGKGFDYSVLLDEDDIVSNNSTPPPAEDAHETKDELLQAPTVVEKGSEEDESSWNTVQKPQHGHHSASQNIPTGGVNSTTQSYHHNRKDSSGFSTGGSFGKSPRFPSGNNIHHGSAGNRRGPRPSLSERQPINLSPETTIEMYDFPIAFRTNDLKNVLNKFTGRYRLKWHNDTSCWAVFNEAEDVEEALSLPDENLKFRRYDPANDTSTLATPSEEPDHEHQDIEN